VLEIEERLDLGEKVGSIAPAADGGLIVAGAHHVHVIDAHGERSASIRVIPDGQRSRLNDGTVDPAGRFLVGSIRLDDRQGCEKVWSIDADRSVHEVIDGVTVSNGIGFSPAGDTLFHVETRPGAIRAFDYDLASGRASRERVMLACGGTPDGLAVDAGGNLWVAFFGEGQVRCLTLAGEVIDVIDVAAPNVTCPEFAGPGLRSLVITTARFRMDESGLRRWPMAGAVFVADLEVPGLPPRPWAGSTD
jgi:sugar lactone lactonase YvrE